LKKSREAEPHAEKSASPAVELRLLEGFFNGLLGEIAQSPHRNAECAVLPNLEYLLGEIVMVI